MWPSKDRDESNFIPSNFCSFLFVTLLPSMFILTDFSVVTRRWHFSPFGFIWFSLNHVNRLSVQFFSLLNWQCINLCHMCHVYYHQRSWQYHILTFQKTCRRYLYLERSGPNIDPCNSTFYMSVEAVKSMYFCCLFSLIKVTEKKTQWMWIRGELSYQEICLMQSQALDRSVSNALPKPTLSKLVSFHFSTIISRQFWILKPWQKPLWYLERIWSNY